MWLGLVCLFSVAIAFPVNDEEEWTCSSSLPCFLGPASCQSDQCRAGLSLTPLPSSMNLHLIHHNPSTQSVIAVRIIKQDQIEPEVFICRPDERNVVSLHGSQASFIRGSISTDSIDCAMVIPFEYLATESFLVETGFMDGASFVVEDSVPVWQTMYVPKPSDDAIVETRQKASGTVPKKDDEPAASAVKGDTEDEEESSGLETENEESEEGKKVEKELKKEVEKEEKKIVDDLKALKSDGEEGDIVEEEGADSETTTTTTKKPFEPKKDSKMNPATIQKDQFEAIQNRAFDDSDDDDVTEKPTVRASAGNKRKTEERKEKKDDKEDGKKDKDDKKPSNTTTTTTTTTMKPDDTDDEPDSSSTMAVFICLLVPAIALVL